MSDLSLYKTCLRKVAINLGDGIYKSCHKNPFSSMSSICINDLMSAALGLLREDELRADDLEPLLTSGRLGELKIHYKDVHVDSCHTVNQVLRFLKSSCQELQVLHLTADIDEPELISDISESLGNLIRNSPNLNDICSAFRFDLKVLRKCEKLRRIKLKFRPRQRWYDFLARENDHFRQHKYLKLFTICHLPQLDQIPFGDIVVILRHCPELTSLGCLESSEALSLLHNMCITPSELKLRHCFWQDQRYSGGEQKLKNHWGLKDAVLHCPMIEELDLIAFSIQTIKCLRNLRNLVTLNITTYCDENIGAVFRFVLQEIGSRLKHLSFEVYSSVDISVFLQYCPNLESLRIAGMSDPLSASSFIHLPYLKSLAFKDCMYNDAGRIFSQLSNCNQLTHLFFQGFTGFNDESLYQFLERNSFSNLKVAYLNYCSLTTRGFRKFLRNAPQLEILEICDNNLSGSLFERVVRDTKHKAICNEDTISEENEFFYMRSRRHLSCCD